MKNVLLFTFLCLFIFSCDDDNDGGNELSAVAPILNTTDLLVAEGEENKILTVQFGFTEPVDREFIVNYLLQGSTATADTDFIGNDGSLVFEAGDQRKEIEITILRDLIAEEDEAFTVRLSSPSSEFADAIINVTITDNSGGSSGSSGSVGSIVIPNGRTSPESYAGYTLVWEDDFDQSVLNSSDWNFETGNGCPDLCGWGNNELEYYSTDNVSFIDDDYLVIQARPETIGNNEYTSSRITTQGKQSFQYGRIDVRAVLPEGQGIWPAIWMLGEDITSVGWPASGEIDIMELIGSEPGTTHATFHYGQDFNSRQFNGQGISLPAGEKFSDEFHIFSVVWEEDLVQVLMDEQLVFQINPSITNPQPYPFNDEFFFIMNVAVGGNWPGSPDATTPFPQHMIVDYIRVFQK